MLTRFRWRLVTHLRTALALGFCLGLRLTAAIPLAQELSDLPADAAAHFGVLPNGMRYVVMSNKEPKERVSLRLVVMAGSFNETDEQHGLAHYLEHLAFNGSAHFPPGTLVEYLQRMGMGFGADTNASTGSERTMYLLELPNSKEATLDDGFKVFSDYCSGLLLDEKEIAREQGVILSEKRTGDSPGFRTYLDETKFLFPNALISRRNVIGTTDTIEHATKARFLDLYNTWYRPERMAVIAVGDFDAAVVEKQIVATFSKIEVHGPARPDPEIGPITATPGLKVRFHPEPEAGTTTVALENVRQIPDEPDTAALRASRIPRTLATLMLNYRLSLLSKKEDAAFISGSVEAFEQFRFVRIAGIQLDCKPELWEKALGVAEQEMRRAMQFGFQEAELNEVKASYINGLEQAVKTAPTRKSRDIASQIASAIVDRRVFVSPETNLTLLKPVVEKTTAAECTAALREIFSNPEQAVYLSGNAKVEGDAEAALRSAYEKSRVVAVTAPEKISTAQFAYADFGPAGKIASRKQVEDLVLTLVTFENGVRLNLKKTDFEAGKIGLFARIGAGELSEQNDKPGLGFFTDGIFSLGGLGKHSVDDLRRILAGKTVGVRFQAATDNLSFTGATNQKDLALELKLLTASISDPGFRPEAARQVPKFIEQYYGQIEHEPFGPILLDFTRLISGGDSRFGVPAKDVMMSRTMEESKAWVLPQLQQGPIEIGIVGDIDIDQTIQFVAETLGTLPKRAGDETNESARIVRVPAEAIARDYTFSTKIPKGLVAVYWPTTDARDVKLTRRLNLLASVFSDRLRLKVRQELGDAYSPSAGSSMSDTFRNYGFISTSIIVDPSKTKVVHDAVLSIAKQLAEKPITEDELERAKKPILTSLRESERTNAYWLNAVVVRAQSSPERLDWARSRYADFASITTAELSSLAQTYLGGSRVFSAIVVPEVSASPPAADKTVTTASAPTDK